MLPTSGLNPPHWVGLAKAGGAKEVRCSGRVRRCGGNALFREGRQGKLFDNRGLRRDKSETRESLNLLNITQ